jgi:hypothetical protein
MCGASNRMQLFRRRIIGAATTFLCLVMMGVGSGGCGRSSPPVSSEPGAAWIDELRVHIVEEVDDASTVKQLMVELDSMEVVVREFDAATLEYYKNLLQLDREYASSRADFETLLQAFNATRALHRDQIMEIRFRLHEISTPAQWKILTDIDQGLFVVWQRELEL